MAWILDTNVLSELRRPKAEPRVLDFVASIPLTALHVSVVTLAEIRYGIDLSPDSRKRAVLEEWLKLTVRPMFDPQRILAVTEDIFVRWRILMEQAARPATPTPSRTFSLPPRPSSMA